ncbi:MAG: hydrogenase 4 subunit F [Nitrospinae bacterium]|nr:hydrogenase 4 subunit F [Nitrospinota bacterium]
MLIVSLLGVSLFFAAVLAFVGDRRFAPELNVVASLTSFVISVALALDVYRGGPSVVAGEYFFVDSFSVYLVVLTTFVSATTAYFSKNYMRFERAHGKVSGGKMRFYHAMYQLFIFAMLLALLANNVGILWISMELATLATVLLVSLYRNPSSVEAAWKYFILCGVGIALALFGTILLYFAAEKVVGQGVQGLLWTNLIKINAKLEPRVLALAFIFFMVGYGTKVGLVPLHNWLPDAHSEGPTPVSAVLSGLLLNIALYALIRCKVLVNMAIGGDWAGKIMMGFGLISMVIAALSLYRQKDIKRMFAYSSIEHMGISTFAFGLGGPIATFGGLLHMLMHSLTKSSIFYTAGHASQIYGTQSMAHIRGLIRANPKVGWGLMFGVLAIAGAPPFGLFASEFLIITAAMKTTPVLMPVILFALVVAFAALFRKAQPMVFGDPTHKREDVNFGSLPVYLHMALVLFLGVYIPVFLQNWFLGAVEILK